MHLSSEELFSNGELGFDDRRLFARFRAELSLKYSSLDSNRQIKASIHDLGAKGLGVFTDEVLAPQSQLDIWLKMPDNDEEILTKGKVIWSERIGPNKYRVGIELEKPELMVISIVLRTIHVETG
jgi:hypothetical protein